MKVSLFGVSQTESASIVSKYGIFMLVLFGVTAVCLFLKKSKSAIVPAAINAIFCVAKMIQELSEGAKQIKELGLDSSMASVNLNIFYWLVVILSVVEIVAILVLPKVMGKK